MRAANFVVKRSGLTGITGSQLLAETTIAADPNVDAIDFTVSDTNPLTAQKLATAWAQETNVYSNILNKTGLKATIAKLTKSLDHVQRHHSEEHRPPGQRRARDARPLAKAQRSRSSRTPSRRRPRR